MGNVGLDLLGNKSLHLEILVMSKKGCFGLRFSLLIASLLCGSICLETMSEFRCVVTSSIHLC